jgi:hypothetical protein
MIYQNMLTMIVNTVTTLVLRYGTLATQQYLGFPAIIHAKFGVSSGLRLDWNQTISTRE